MDSEMNSPPPENCDSKAAFRKPSNDNANRKYRRHSAADGSLAPDGSPRRGHSPNPVITREGSGKDSAYRKVHDKRELNRDSVRDQDARRGDSYHNSDRHSRSSHNYDKHDGYRHDKHANYDERNHKSYKFCGGSRDKSESDKSESNLSKGYARNVDKYPRDKFEGAGNRPMGKEVNDRKYEDRDLSSDRRINSKYDDGKHGKGDFREPHDSKHTRPEKRKLNDSEINRHQERFSRQAGEQYEDKTDTGSKIRQSPPKKQTLSGFDRGSNYGKEAVKSGSTSSTHGVEDVAKLTLEQTHGNSSELAPDLNAAKFAAIKAAESVNRNLVGGGVGIGAGVLSTDQKKKLLWGNKKNTAVEESGHRWDATLFPDRERQEKFNKLMGVKGDAKIAEDTQETLAEKQNQLQLDLEKQYTAGLRRRDGRTVGLGL